MTKKRNFSLLTRICFCFVQFNGAIDECAKPIQELTHQGVEMFHGLRSLGNVHYGLYNNTTLCCCMPWLVNLAYPLGHIHAYSTQQSSHNLLPPPLQRSNLTSTTLLLQSSWSYLLTMSDFNPVQRRNPQDDSWCLCDHPTLLFLFWDRL